MKSSCTKRLSKPLSAKKDPLVDEFIRSIHQEREDFLSNLTLSHEKIRQKAKNNLLLALEHPNCPPDVWWRGVIQYPIEAMESSVFGIMTLEDPGRWQTLMGQHCRQWLDCSMKYLSPRMEQCWLCDCLEHALPRFEETYGDAMPLRDCMAARRAYAQQKISAKEWRDIQAKARNYTKTLVKRPGNLCWDFAKAVYGRQVSKAIQACQRIWCDLYRYGGRALLPTNINFVDLGKEVAWQWERLLQYSRSEIIC